MQKTASLSYSPLFYSTVMLESTSRAIPSLSPDNPIWSMKHVYEETPDGALLLPGIYSRLKPIIGR